MPDSNGYLAVLSGTKNRLYETDNQIKLKICRKSG